MTAVQAPAPAPAPRLLRRRGASRRLLLAVLLAVVGALLAAYAYRSLADRAGVVALTRSLPYGAVVQLSDLREVQLPTDHGLTTIPWTAVGSVVGRLASTDLRAGQTLTPDALTTDRLPAPGAAVVGLSVEPGRVPSLPLQPRDAVLVVVGTAPPVSGSIVAAGEVDVSGRRSVDVLVARRDAESLARASVEGAVAIVLVARG